MGDNGLSLKKKLVYFWFPSMIQATPKRVPSNKDTDLFMGFRTSSPLVTARTADSSRRVGFPPHLLSIPERVAVAVLGSGKVRNIQRLVHTLGSGGLYKPYDIGTVEPTVLTS